MNALPNQANKPSTDLPFPYPIFPVSGPGHRLFNDHHPNGKFLGGEIAQETGRRVLCKQGRRCADEPMSMLAPGRRVDWIS